MSSIPDTFDVEEVVHRAVAMDVPAASERELRWADRAADRVRAWVDAWQAQVQFELTLPRPLPDLGDNDQTSTDDETEPSPGSDEAAPGAPPTPDAGADQPLPSLGPAPEPQESPAERARKERRSFLLTALSAFAEALRAGRITTGHVDVLAAAVDRLPGAIRDRVLARGDDLLAAACAKTPERFSRAIQLVIARAYDDEGVDRATAQRARSDRRLADG